MQCPVCKNTALSPVLLEQGLPSQQCPRCRGHWLGLNDYQAWLEAKGEILPEKPPSAHAPIAQTVKRAKLCPQCDHLLLKYKLGRGTDISLDYCGQCGGVWFDKDEWAVLKDMNLHDEVYKIFTQSWQKKVRIELSHQHLSQHYQHKFGSEDYAKIRALKAWLIAHPESSALLAYLNNADPYQ